MYRNFFKFSVLLLLSLATSSVSTYGMEYGDPAPSTSLPVMVYKYLFSPKEVVQPAVAPVIEEQPSKIFLYVAVGAIGVWVGKKVYHWANGDTTKVTQIQPNTHPQT